MLSLDAYSEELSEAQKLRQQKIDEELQKMNNIIDQLVKQTGAQILYQGEICTSLQMAEALPLPKGNTNQHVFFIYYNVVFDKKSLLWLL